MRHFLSAAALLLLSVPLSPAADEPFAGKVVGISDGDTLTVIRQTGAKTESVTVRLNGVDAPETGQPFGAQSKKFTSNLTYDKPVVVVPKTYDLYGRLVAEIILPEGTNLSHEIVRAGYGWWYREYCPDHAVLGALENAARRNRWGLWAGNDPIPPWQFRHGGATPISGQTPAASAVPTMGKKEETPMTRSSTPASTAAARKNGTPGAPVALARKTPLPARTAATGIGSGDRADRAGLGTVVYITKSGKRYHRSTCYHLRKGGLQTTLRDAKGNGLTPCSACKPPG
jgi:endonuclease YncB( thermonuclease family)